MAPAQPAKAAARVVGAMRGRWKARWRTRRHSTQVAQRCRSLACRRLVVNKMHNMENNAENRILRHMIFHGMA